MIVPVWVVSSALRSLTCTEVMSPSSSLFTTIASTILMKSRLRRRSSSAAICPVKFGSAKPSTSIWTGPISDPIGEMYDAFVRLLDQRLVMRRVEVIPGDTDQASHASRTHSISAHGNPLHRAYRPHASAQANTA